MAKKLFKKGDPKPENAGRKKGTPNKRTVAQREAFESIMELIEQRMLDGDDVINSLSPARAAELYTNLLNYKKPKLSSNKNENDNTISGGLNVIVTYGDDNIKEDGNDG